METLEARIWTFETVAMYTITVLLTLSAPGAVQLHWLQMCWEQRHRPLGPIASNRQWGIPKAKWLCSHAAVWWEEKRDCREAQLFPLYCHAGHIFHKEAARVPSLSFSPVTLLNLVKASKLNSWQQLVLLKAPSQKRMDWIYSATVAIRQQALVS